MFSVVTFTLLCISLRWQLVDVFSSLIWKWSNRIFKQTDAGLGLEMETTKYACSQCLDRLSVQNISEWIVPSNNKQRWNKSGNTKVLENSIVQNEETHGDWSSYEAVTKNNMENEQKKTLARPTEKGINQDEAGWSKDLTSGEPKIDQETWDPSHWGAKLTGTQTETCQEQCMRQGTIYCRVQQRDDAI